MDNRFEQLGQDEILSLEWSNYGKPLNLSSNNFSCIYLKPPEFIEAIKRCLNVGTELKNNLFAQGIDCEALRFGQKSWQKGKVRIKVLVEFSPDEPEVEATQASNEINEPESPLDDLRQMINQEAKQQNS